MILKRDLIPMQDDPENDTGRVGVQRRPNANINAEREALTGRQMDEFVTGSEGIGFTGESRAAIYAWTERLLVVQEFLVQSKKGRGAIRMYASKVTGLSLPQIHG